MTALVRWRTGAFVAMAAGALLPLTLAQWARGRYERALAARDATAAAAYLTIVTPPPPAGRGAGYDLPQLFIRARALDADPTAVGGQQLARDRQADAAAAARLPGAACLVCPIEALEDVRQVLGRDPRAGIADPKLHLAPR